MRNICLVLNATGTVPRLLNVVAWTRCRCTTGNLTSEVWQYPCADINDYLVNVTSFVTWDQLKSHKSLKSHNYLTSGFVQQPKVKIFASGNIVVGKVRHSVV